MPTYKVVGTVEAYPDDDLPDGFVYPTQFTELVGKTDILEFYPWKFIKPSAVPNTTLLELTRNHFPGFVPFAVDGSSDGNHVGFDGYDTSGNPKVIMVFFDGSNTPQEKGYFSDWLKRAKSDAKQWARDQERLAALKSSKRR